MSPAVLTTSALTTSALTTSVLTRAEPKQSVPTWPREIFPAVIPELAITPVATALWRVSRIGGAVLGHIERLDDGELVRYASRRLLSGGIRSMPLGEFWSPHDAAECFR